MMSGLEGTREEGNTLLVRHAVAALRKMAGRKDYTNVTWRHKTGRDSTRYYRITKRDGHIIYYAWDALGAYPPRGTSHTITIGQFIREFEAA